MAREDYGKLFFCCSAFLVSSRPVSIVGPQMFSCRSQRREFCEPPQGGASARTAERRILALYAAAAPNIFSFHLSALPPVAYSSLLRSLRTMNSLVPTRCATRSSSRFVILRSRATKNLYKSIRRQILDCTSFVSLLLARHSPQAAFGSQGKRFFASLRMTK